MEVFKVYEYGNYNVTKIKSDEVCASLYDVLALLSREKYIEVYTALYNKRDMLYQIFRDDYDVESFIIKIKKAVDEKNFYDIYDPIIKIIETIISKSHPRA